jgi:hypothetical protein
MDGEFVTVLLAGATPIGGRPVSRQQETEIRASTVEPHPPCPHCGANRKILTDLDVRTRLGGERGKTVSSYTTQVWRARGEGPPWFKAAGRILHFEDEFVAWLESKRQTSTSSESANSDTTVDFDETSTDEKDGKWWDGRTS